MQSIHSDQYASSPSNRAHCYAEIAVSSPAVCHVPLWHDKGLNISGRCVNRSSCRRRTKSVSRSKAS